MFLKSCQLEQRQRTAACLSLPSPAEPAKPALWLVRRQHWVFSHKECLVVSNFGPVAQSWLLNLHGLPLHRKLWCGGWRCILGRVQRMHCTGPSVTVQYLSWLRGACDWQLTPHRPAGHRPPLYGATAACEGDKRLGREPLSRVRTPPPDNPTNPVRPATSPCSALPYRVWPCLAVLATVQSGGPAVAHTPLGCG